VNKKGVQGFGFDTLPHGWNLGVNFSALFHQRRGFLLPSMIMPRSTFSPEFEASEDAKNMLC